MATFRMPGADKLPISAAATSDLVVL
eukprot:COSAG01_NODE_57622_length_311_cov_0.721698_1_plen_25_part_01